MEFIYWEEYDDGNHSDVSDPFEADDLDAACDLAREVVLSEASEYEGEETLRFTIWVAVYDDYEADARCIVVTVPGQRAVQQ